MQPAVFRVTVRGLRGGPRGICRAIVYCCNACAVLRADRCGSFAQCLANLCTLTCSYHCCIWLSMLLTWSTQGAMYSNHCKYFVHPVSLERKKERKKGINSSFITKIIEKYAVEYNLTWSSSYQFCQFSFTTTAEFYKGLKLAWVLKQQNMFHIVFYKIKQVHCNI